MIEPQAIVIAFMRAIGEQRFDDARALLHDDVVVYEMEGVPYSGEYRGPQAFFDLFGQMKAAMELTPGDEIQYLLAEDTVAIRYRLKLTSRVSGKSVEMGMVEIYTVRTGLIVELDVYYKDPSAVSALLAL
jgi:ketosteroid isomerase-like protein